MINLKHKIMPRYNPINLLMSRLNSISCEGDSDYKKLIFYIKLASLGSNRFAWPLHDSIRQYYEKFTR